MSFFRLIRPKLPFIVFFIEALFIGIMLIIGLVISLNYKGESQETVSEIALMLVSVSTTLTSFIVLLVTITERSKWKRKEAALRQSPFIDLERYGFVQSVFLKRNRWWLNDTAYVKLIKRYPVIINSFSDHYAEILILVKPGYKIGTAQESGLIIKEPGIAINIALNGSKITSFREVEDIINNVVNQLDLMSIEPETSVSAYDHYLSGIKWAEVRSQFNF